MDGFLTLPKCIVSIWYRCSNQCLFQMNKAFPFPTKYFNRPELHMHLFRTDCLYSVCNIRVDLKIWLLNQQDSVYLSSVMSFHFFLLRSFCTFCILHFLSFSFLFFVFLSFDYMMDIIRNGSIVVVSIGCCCWLEWDKIQR